MPVSPAGWIDLAQINGPVRRNLDLAVERANSYAGDHYGSRRNKLRNGTLVVWQRGFGAVTGNNPLGFDGWRAEAFGSTHSWDGVQFGLGGEVTQSGGTLGGQESATHYARNTFTGVVGAGNYSLMYHGIENVRTLAGKTATFSFWGRSTVAGKVVGVELAQNFGTGGAPSGQVLISPKSVTMVGTTWAKYSVTFDIPSIAGKTIGTSGGDNLQLILWFSADSFYAARSGGVGVQSGTLNFYGFQLEEGTVPTPTEDIGLPAQTAWCQRYLQYMVSSVVNSTFMFGVAYSTTAIACLYTHPVPMRGTVTLSGNPGNITDSNFGVNYAVAAISTNVANNIPGLITVVEASHAAAVLTTNRPYVLRSSAIGQTLGFSAEY